MFFMTPPSSLGCHFQTNRARDGIGLILKHFVCIFYIYKDKHHSYKFQSFFYEKIQEESYFKLNFFVNFLKNHTKMKNDRQDRSRYIIYKKTASIWDQSQLSSSSRLEMRAYWNWKGQKWNFVICWFSFCTYFWFKLIENFDYD